MKTAVIYRSATGFTKKYAEWIAKDLSADLFASSQVTLEQMKGYDCIVFGGRLHAVGIDGLSRVMRNFEKLKGKRLIVFASGASPATEEVLKVVRDKNLTPQQQAHVRMFYFRGGFNYAALPFFDKLLMGLMKRKIIRKQGKGDPLKGDEAGMLELFAQPADFTDRGLIREIVKAARMEI